MVIATNRAHSSDGGVVSAFIRSSRSGLRQCSSGIDRNRLKEGRRLRMFILIFRAVSKNPNFNIKYIALRWLAAKPKAPKVEITSRGVVEFTNHFGM